MLPTWRFKSWFFSVRVLRTPLLAFARSAASVQAACTSLLSFIYVVQSSRWAHLSQGSISEFRSRKWNMIMASLKGSGFARMTVQVNTWSVQSGNDQLGTPVAANTLRDRAFSTFFFCGNHGWRFTADLKCFPPNWICQIPIFFDFPWSWSHCVCTLSTQYTSCMQIMIFELDIRRTELSMSASESWIDFRISISEVNNIVFVFCFVFSDFQSFLLFMIMTSLTTSCVAWIAVPVNTWSVHSDYGQFRILVAANALRDRAFRPHFNLNQALQHKQETTQFNMHKKTLKNKQEHNSK